MQESVESDHEEDVTTAVTIEAPRRNEVMKTLPTSAGQPLEKKRRRVVFSTQADIDARRRKKRQAVAEDKGDAVLEEAIAPGAASSSSGYVQTPAQSASHEDVSDTTNGKADGEVGGGSPVQGMPCSTSPMRVHFEEPSLTQMFEDAFDQDDQDDDLI